MGANFFVKVLGTPGGRILLAARRPIQGDLYNRGTESLGYGGHRSRLPEEIMNMKDFRRTRKRVAVSVGESVRIVRELQGLTQNKLSKLTGIPQSTISAIENDSVNLGVERAKVLARALNCHPAVLVFPGWEVEKESAA